MSFELELIEDL